MSKNEDSSENRPLEEILNTAEGMRIMFEESPVAKVIIGADGKIIAANEKIAELVGEKKENIPNYVGTMDWINFFVEKEKIIQMHTARMKAVEEKKSLQASTSLKDTYTTDLVDLQGNLKHINIRVKVLPQKESIIILEDLTEPIERNKELETLCNISEIKYKSIDKILKKAIKIMPKGMLFSKEAYARIIYDGKGYCSCGQENCEHKAFKNSVSAKIENGKPIEVIIGYIKDKNFIPKYEQKLVESIAKSLKDKLNYIESEEKRKEFAKLKERETHHRVKNNFQIASALVSMQMRNIIEYIEEKECSTNPKEEITKYIEKTQSELTSKIEAMANFNETLYRFGTEDDGTLSLSKYIHLIIPEIKNNYSEESKKIPLEEKIESGLYIDIDKGISCGLIVNELVSNVYKYTKKGGQARIDLEKVNNHILIRVYNTSQFPYESIEEAEKQSFGLSIVQGLVEQINAKLYLDKSKGTEFTLEIPIKHNTA